MDLPKQVEIVDVGPRDGLQNIAQEIPTDRKIELVNRLVGAGLSRIEVTSFSHPKWVPQLRDAEQVLKQTDRSCGTRIMVLIPNLRGYDRVRQCLRFIDEVAVVISATETMNQKNVNRSTADSMQQFAQITGLAKSDGLRVRGSIGVSFVCPYEGKTPPQATLQLASEFFRMGVDEVMFADTIGRANPSQVYELLALARDQLPDKQLAAHFHDTYNMALANTVAAMQAGVAIFDSSVGGLGGCPFTPTGAGNVATEKLVFMLHEMGIQTGIDYQALSGVAQLAQLIRQPETVGSSG